MYTNAWSLYADLTSQNRSNQDGTIIFLLREADASYMYTYVLQRFFVVVVVVVVVVVLLFLLFFLSQFSVALRRQRPYGLSGTGSPGRPPRLSHSA